MSWSALSIRYSGESAFTWTDKGRGADEYLYSGQGRSGPVAAAFLIGPDVPECTRECRVQWGLHCDLPVSNYWPAYSRRRRAFVLPGIVNLC